MDLSEDHSEPMVFFNPELSGHEGSQTYEEGCLSVPEHTAEVKRAATVFVRALDIDGQPFELQAEGLQAVCIQHEVGRLDGKLFMDYLSPLRRRMVDKQLREREAATRGPEAV